MPDRKKISLSVPLTSTSTSALILTLIFFSLPLLSYAQDNVLFLREGRLWETINLAKIGPTFNNWARSGYGMDHPGYEPNWIAGHTGLAPSHHCGGGFWITALSPSGSVWGVEDFALYAGSVGFEPTAKYIAQTNRFVYPDKSNYFQQTNPHAGELCVETIFQWNPQYIFPYSRQAFLPIRVSRRIHQWVTHEIDQDYIICDYVITNVGDSTMHKTYLMFLYGFAINARGWSILFPDYNQGARNTRMVWDGTRRLMYGYAANFSETPGDDAYDYWEQGGPNRQGEYLAPGYAGLKFLYISPDSSGRANRIHKYGWAASHPTQASHPFTNQGTLDAEYQIIRNPALATDAITSMGDTRWGSTRVWTMLTVGPWDLAPGDSIRIVLAELVGSVPYETVINPATQVTHIAKGKNILLDLAARAQACFDRDFDLPDPPAPPYEFQLNHLAEDKVGARLSWSDANEAIPDPDYTGSAALDFAGYKIYRSNYLPIGPWDSIGVIARHDPQYFDNASGKYSFIDSALTIGESYYYAITAYDQGHPLWPPDPGSYPSGVPPLESSKYVNRTIQPFRAGLGPSKNLARVLVVPNPFIMSSGLTIPGDEDIIQFVNVPSPCTIRIYTVRGDLVKIIEHKEEVGTATWDQVTSWGQFVESGIYIYHITSHAADSKNQTVIGKFSIIR